MAPPMADERWRAVVNDLHAQREVARERVAELEVRTERAERLAGKLREAYDEVANIIRVHDDRGGQLGGNPTLIEIRRVIASADIGNVEDAHAVTDAVADLVDEALENPERGVVKPHDPDT